MKYSFVLPAYKILYFKEAIDSILAQTYTDFELIIVNDASPEDLEAIVKDYNDSRIRYYVNTQNLGGKDLVAQWNHCLEFAKSDYVILASDDDVYMPNYLEKMNILVDNNPDVDIFRPRIQIVDENNCVKRIYDCINGKIGSFEFIYNLHLDNIGSAIGYYIINRKTLIANGGFVNFPMAWGSDDATAILLSENGVAFESELLFSFRMSGVNISATYNYDMVRLKLKSSNLYYKFVKSYINNFHREALPLNEVYYYDCIKADLDNLIQRNTRFLIDKLSFVPAMKCLFDIISFEWVTAKFVFKRIARQLLKIISII